MAYCIMLSGKPLAGKDESANYIAKEYGFKKCELKIPMYAVAAAIFNLESYSYFIDRKLKEKKIKRWGLSPREMLQKIGYEMKRVFGGDIWCRHLLDKIGTEDNIVISDNRYKDEIDFFKQHFEVITIRLIRPTMKNKIFGVKDHVAEKGDFETDYLISNNKDIENLNKKLDVYLIGNGIELSKWSKEDGQD